MRVYVVQPRVMLEIETQTTGKSEAKKCVHG